MKATLADLARSRLRFLPPRPPHPALRQAKVDFFEALVNRNPRGAKDASAIMAQYARPEPPLSMAGREKRRQRTRFLAKWVWALRERKDEEARGIVHPKPTPEEAAAAEEALEQLKRWLAGRTPVVLRIVDGPHLDRTPKHVRRRPRNLLECAEPVTRIVQVG